MSRILSNQIQEEYYGTKNGKENAPPTAKLKTTPPPAKPKTPTQESKQMQESKDVNSDTVISGTSGGDTSQFDIEKEIEEEREMENRESQQRFKYLIHGEGRRKSKDPAVEEEEEEDEDEIGKTIEMEDEEEDDWNFEKGEDEEGPDDRTRTDDEELLYGADDTSLQVKSDVVAEIPADKSIDMPLMGSTPKTKNKNSRPLRDEYNFEEDMINISTGRCDEMEDAEGSVYPRKRLGDVSSGPTKKRGRKIIIEEADLEKTDNDRKKEIDKCLKNAAANIDYQSSFIRCAMMNKVNVNRDQGAIDTIFNQAYESASINYAKAVEDGKSSRSIGGAKKVEDEVSKANEEVINVKRAAIRSVQETLRLMRTDDIRWPDNAELPTEREVIKYSLDITQGKIDGMRLYVRGMIKQDGNRSILWIVEGMVKVLAFRRLEERINVMCPGKYLPPEEDNEVFLPNGVCSQPAAGTSDRETPARGSSQQNQEKMINPYGRIFCMVLDKNNSVIPDQDIAFIKNMTKPKEPEKSVRQKCMELVKSIKIMMPGCKTQKKIKEELANSDIPCPIDCLKVAMLKDDQFNQVMDVMEKFPDLNNSKFCGRFTSARKTSQVTADRVLADLLRGEVDAATAMEVLSAHDKRIAFILMGKTVHKKHAEEVESRIEDSKVALQRIRYHTAAKHRLEPLVLQKIRNEPMQILMELERDLNPCIGFKRAYVEQRDTNSGGKGSKERCLVNFISLQDLARSPDIFTSIVSSRNRDTYFVVTHDGLEDVEGILKEAHNGIGGVKVFVDCERFINTASSARTPTDGLYCVIIGGSTKAAWTSQHLKQELDKYGIFSSVNNGQMRKLIYNVYKADDTVKDIDKYNSIFAHSTTDEIVAIISKFAPNRVYTSSNNIADFAERLRKSQKATTRGGDTFKGIGILKKEKPRAADD